MATRPNNVAGLLSWYTASPNYCFSDATGAVPCADGDLVQFWKDRQGTNNLVQSTSSLRPTFRIVSGIQVVDFDGSRYMDAGTPWVTAAPCCFAAWFNPDVLTSTLVGCGQSGTNLNQFRLNVTAAGKIDAYTASSGSSAATTTLVTDLTTGNWVYGLGSWLAANRRTAYRNGGESGTGVTSLVPTVASINTGRIGGNLQAGTLLDGRISEVAIWNVSLDDATIGSLFGSGLPSYASSDGKSF